MTKAAQSLAFRLAVCIYAIGAFITVAPSAASACVNAATAKSFHGGGAVTSTLSATGTDPGLGGTQTATLDRSANLHLKLTDKVVGEHGNTVFSGKVTQGSVVVNDSFESSASGFEGNAKVDGQPPKYGSASLEFSRSKCKYVLSFGFGVVTNFSGDEALKPPPTANGAVESGPEPLSHSLHLGDSGNMNAYLTCPDGFQACYTFGGTWTTEFAPLALCGSIVATNCKDDTKPVGTAAFTWLLLPTFEHKKK